MTTQVLANVNPRYFLNQLALEHAKDSMLLDPDHIIRQLLAQRPYAHLVEMFEDFCEAAVAPAYCWKQHPGKLKAFSEDLEKLIEACFLLRRNRKQNLPGQPKALQHFFTTYSLPEWKKILHEWTLAALSRNSIAEIGDPMDMIPFVKGMEALIKAMAGFAEQANPTPDH